MTAGCAAAPSASSHDCNRGLIGECSKRSFHPAADCAAELGADPGLAPSGSHRGALTPFCALLGPPLPIEERETEQSRYRQPSEPPEESTEVVRSLPRGMAAAAGVPAATRLPPEEAAASCGWT